MKVKVVIRPEGQLRSRLGLKAKRLCFASDNVNGASLCKTIRETWQLHPDTTFMFPTSRLKETQKKVSNDDSDASEEEEDVRDTYSPDYIGDYLRQKGEGKGMDEDLDQKWSGSKLSVFVEAMNLAASAKVSGFFRCG